MRNTTKSACLCVVAMVALLAAIEVPVSALTPIDVPEISNSTLSAGVALLTAGVLVLRARWRRK
jgi:hypothetical protein